VATGGSDLADAATPFVHEAWYVIAVRTEVGREPLARTALGRSIVLYRTEAGEVVALRNRCCHRSYPLSRGRIEGDTIVCGYHGLRYAPSGRCIEIPMQAQVPPVMRVHAYPTVELGPLVWFWPGDPARADRSLVPHQHWMDDPAWDSMHGYLHVGGSYVHLHENLLDLSHLSFLHANTFGTPEYARAPVEIVAGGERLEVWREVECRLPPIYARPLGWEGMRALRRSGSRFVAPGLHVNTGEFHNLDDPALTGDPPPTVRFGQVITPETAHSTHYWSIQARNFARGDAAMSEFMLGQQFAVFREDCAALAAITELSLLERDESFREFSIPTDRAGVLMRRRLKMLADAERRPG
jgi:vanillate O-demethylase monooxygenase subunit